MGATYRRRTAGVGQAPSPVPPAKPAPRAHQRKLPHIQRRRATLFITFTTHNRRPLDGRLRSIVMDCCRHHDGTKYILHAAVVMPDHVHVLLSPLADADGNTYGLTEIMHGIKGASAHAVNRASGRRGKVWQAESLDHVLRSDESLRQKAEYICENPVRANLAASSDDYPWLYRAWVQPDDAHQREGQARAPVPTPAAR